ncbi:MAG: DUF4405 domain-containing protein [Planctomycetaceae bacterium]
MPTKEEPTTTRRAGPDGAPAAPRRRGVSWSDVNLALDAALLVNFVGLCIAAVIVRFVFPPGPAAREWLLWGLDYDAWAGIQFTLLAVLAVGILVHVMFHWSWVCNVLAARLARGGKGRVDEGTQTIYGVGLLIVLLHVIGITVAAAWLTIRPPGG